MERPPGLRPGAGGPWEMRERLGTGGFGNVSLYQHRVRRAAGGSSGAGAFWASLEPRLSVKVGGVVAETLGSERVRGIARDPGVSEVPGK